MGGRAAVCGSQCVCGSVLEERTPVARPFTPVCPPLSGGRRL